MATESDVIRFREQIDRLSDAKSDLERRVEELMVANRELEIEIRVLKEIRNADRARMPVSSRREPDGNPRTYF